MLRIVLLIALLLGGCSTVLRQETMLPDGGTWAVTMENMGLCKGQTAVDTCVERLMPDIKTRAKELCQVEPSRIYGCMKLVGDGIMVRCYIECK